MTTSQKVKALKVLQSRANEGKSASIVKLKGKEVDKKKLRRHLKEAMRRGETESMLQPSRDEYSRPFLVQSLVFGKSL